MDEKQGRIDEAGRTIAELKDRIQQGNVDEFASLAKMQVRTGREEEKRTEKRREEREEEKRTEKSVLEKVEEYV